MTPNEKRDELTMALLGDIEAEREYAATVKSVTFWLLCVAIVFALFAAVAE